MLFIFQALDALLDLSASSFEQSGNSRCFNDTVNSKEDNRFLIENSDNVSTVMCC